MKLTVAHDHQLPAGVLGLALSPDGTQTFAACADGTLQAVDPVTGKAEPFAEKHHSFASGCVLLPDGKTVISGGYDGWLLWHDVATRRCWRRSPTAWSTCIRRCCRALPVPMRWAMRLPAASR